MAKKTTSFRLSEDRIDKLSILSELFRESGGEAVERAIDYLYENRLEQARLDLENRLKGMGTIK